jgi:serine/threonine protein phosphatase PrpC
VLCGHCHEPVEASFAFCEACGFRLTGDGTTLAAGPTTPVVATLAASAAQATHPGRKHAENQDAVGLLELGSGVALALADGVSSSYAGRLAAETAVREALATLRANGAPSKAELVRRAVQRAHEAVCQLPYPGSPLDEPQATLAVALIHESTLWYAWVGDSRVYLLEPGTARQLSKDDSWLQDRLDLGEAYATAIASPDAHFVTQCLGTRDETPQVHVGHAALAADALVLLCSDGLWNYLANADVLQARLRASLASMSLGEACAELVAYANSAGGSDNISAALYRFSPSPACGRRRGEGEST